MNKTILFSLFCIITTFLVLYFYLEKDIQTQKQEITICGSTLPQICYIFRCTNSYIVLDGSESMPGGGSRNKMCSDGTTAIQTIVE